MPKAFEVWVENWPAVELFCACSDDWHKDKRGQYLSINKVALGSVMAMFEIENKKAMLFDILAMQDAALGVLGNGR